MKPEPPLVCDVCGIRIIVTPRRDSRHNCCNTTAATRPEPDLFRAAGLLYKEVVVDCHFVMAQVRFSAGDSRHDCDEGDATVTNASGRRCENHANAPLEHAQNGRQRPSCGHSLTTSEDTHPSHCWRGRASSASGWGPDRPPSCRDALTNVHTVSMGQCTHVHISCGYMTRRSGSGIKGVSCPKWGIMLDPGSRLTGTYILSWYKYHSQVGSWIGVGGNRLHPPQARIKIWTHKSTPSMPST